MASSSSSGRPRRAAAAHGAHPRAAASMPPGAVGASSSSISSPISISSIAAASLPPAPPSPLVPNGRRASFAAVAAAPPAAPSAPLPPPTQVATAASTTASRSLAPGRRMLIMPSSTKQAVGLSSAAPPHPSQHHQSLHQQQPSLIQLSANRNRTVRISNDLAAPADSAASAATGGGARPNAGVASMPPRRVSLTSLAAISKTIPFSIPLSNPGTAAVASIPSVGRTSVGHQLGHSSNLPVLSASSQRLSSSYPISILSQSSSSLTFQTDTTSATTATANSDNNTSTLSHKSFSGWIGSSADAFYSQQHQQHAYVSSHNHHQKVAKPMGVSSTRRRGPVASISVSTSSGGWASSSRLPTGSHHSILSPISSSRPSSQTQGLTVTTDTSSSSLGIMQDTASAKMASPNPAMASSGTAASGDNPFITSTPVRRKSFPAHIEAMSVSPTSASKPPISLAVMSNTATTATASGAYDGAKIASAGLVGLGSPIQAGKRVASLTSIEPAESKVARQISSESLRPRGTALQKNYTTAIPSAAETVIVGSSNGKPPMPHKSNDAASIPANGANDNNHQDVVMSTATQDTTDEPNDTPQQTIFSPTYHTVQSTPGSKPSMPAVEATNDEITDDVTPMETSDVEDDDDTYTKSVVMYTPQTQQQHQTTHDTQQQQSDTGAHEEEEVDLDEGAFDPYYFIRTLPPLSREQLCRPCVLPKKTRSSPPITLVLDLDETLVHCSTMPLARNDISFPVVFNGVSYRVSGRLRPHYQTFLRRASELFEVVVFTASQKIYADRLLNLLDPEHKYIKYRLFRDSCLFVAGNYLKDLNVLGRDLSKTVIVDNSPQAFGYQLTNGIPIVSWYEDRLDTELLSVMQFLETIVDVDDVRPFIDKAFGMRVKVFGADAANTNRSKSQI